MGDVPRLLAPAGRRRLGIELVHLPQRLVLAALGFSLVSSRRAPAPHRTKQPRLHRGRRLGVDIVVVQRPLRAAQLLLLAAGRGDDRRLLCSGRLSVIVGRRRSSDGGGLRQPGALGDDRRAGQRHRLLLSRRGLVAVVRGDDAGHALPAVRVCASQYGPRRTTGLPHEVNGRLSPSGHWQPRWAGGSDGAAADGGALLLPPSGLALHERLLIRPAITRSTAHVLQAVRVAHEQHGAAGDRPGTDQCRGAGPEGRGVRRSRDGAFGAVQAEERAGRSWDRRTVVVVDEAAMLNSRVTGELLAEARRTRAKVILAGDDRQLASIERGGLFSELRQRHGSAEISDITRQRTDWQRQAARDLAEGRFAEAVAAFDRAGAITWTQDQVDARVALVAAWRRDTAAEPDATRFVFAYTNRDVDALNAELRQVRRDRGELLGPDVRFETKHGPAAFAPGDRVQFTDTLKAARIQRQCRHHHRHQ